jgi:hypothetical protein
VTEQDNVGVTEQDNIGVTEQDNLGVTEQDNVGVTEQDNVGVTEQDFHWTGNRTNDIRHEMRPRLPLQHRCGFNGRSTSCSD